MSALQVVFITEGNCPNCEAIRGALTRFQHEYRHVEVSEVHPEEPLGKSLAAEHGISDLPALIIDGRLRFVGQASEKLIRREFERARPGQHR